MLHQLFCHKILFFYRIVEYLRRETHKCISCSEAWRKICLHSIFHFLLH